MPLFAYIYFKLEVIPSHYLVSVEIEVNSLVLSISITNLSASPRLTLFSLALHFLPHTTVSSRLFSCALYFHYLQFKVITSHYCSRSRDYSRVCSDYSLESCASRFHHNSRSLPYSIFEVKIILLCFAFPLKLKVVGSEKGNQSIFQWLTVLLTEQMVKMITVSSFKCWDG